MIMDTHMAQREALKAKAKSKKKPKEKTLKAVTGGGVQ